MPRQVIQSKPLINVPDRLLRINDVSAITTLSKSAIRLWVVQGKFPAPCVLSSTISVWRLSQIQSWIDRNFDALIPEISSVDTTLHVTEQEKHATETNSPFLVPNLSGLQPVFSADSHPKNDKSTLAIAKSSDCVDWLHNFAPWSLAATITFKRSIKSQPINQIIAESALRYSLRVLDAHYFGKNGIKKGYCVASAAVIEWGPYGTHPHAHLALATPQGKTYEDIHEQFDHALERTQWINKEKKLIPYRDIGWANYMISKGSQNMVFSLMRKGCGPAPNYSSDIDTWEQAPA